MYTIVKTHLLTQEGGLLFRRGRFLDSGGVSTVCGVAGQEREYFLECISIVQVEIGIEKDGGNVGDVCYG